MVLVHKSRCSEVIEWLDQNVAKNLPYRVPDAERTDESRMNPYRVSVTARVAYWQGENAEWTVTQWGHKNRVEVKCEDPRNETLIAVKWAS